MTGDRETWGWTPERLVDLERMVGEGVSYGEIAKTLGVSRSAAIAKASRMGWGGKRGSPLRPTPAGETPRSARKKPKHPPKLPASVRYAGAVVGGCSWPLGDPKKPGFSFCGDTQAPGRPYCAAHCAVAYTTVKA